MSGFLGVLGTLAQALSGNALVQLGNVTLKSFEIPDTIAWGTRLERHDHLLPGGNKKIDNLGAFDEPIAWEGRFYGADTAIRAQNLDRMLRAGKQVTLSWNGKSRQVLITRFVCSDERGGTLCPYRIEMEVLPQQAGATNATQSAITQLLGNDAGAAVASVTTAVSTVATYADNTVSDVSAVASQVAPIANLIGVGGALTAAQGYLGTATTAIGNISSLSNPGAAIASTTQALTSASVSLQAASSTLNTSLAGPLADTGFSVQTATAASGALGSVAQAQGFVGRMLTNVGMLG